MRATPIVVAEIPGAMVAIAAIANVAVAGPGRGCLVRMDIGDTPLARHLAMELDPHVVAIPPPRDSPCHARSPPSARPSRVGRRCWPRPPDGCGRATGSSAPGRRGPRTSRRGCPCGRRSWASRIPSSSSATWTPCPRGRSSASGTWSRRRAALPCRSRPRAWPRCPGRFAGSRPPSWPCRRCAIEPTTSCRWLGMRRTRGQVVDVRCRPPVPEVTRLHAAVLAARSARWGSCFPPPRGGAGPQGSFPLPCACVSGAARAGSWRAWASPPPCAPARPSRSSPRPPPREPRGSCPPQGAGPR